MPLASDFQPFVAGAPCAVLTRLAGEYLLDRAALNRLFADTADRQYQVEWTFDLIVTILLDVVCGAHASVHASLQARVGHLPASAASFYAKLGRMEPGVGAALVRDSADRAGGLIRALGGVRREPVPGVRTLILDGTMPAGTDRRLKPLRGSRAAPLPGQVLAVYECRTGLVTQAVFEEDAYAQERALLPRLRLPQGVHVLADRNFCTRGFLAALAANGTYFTVRRHASFPVPDRLADRPAGRNATGRVSEATFPFVGDSGRVRPFRRVTVRLDTPTRGGDRTIVLITNLPPRVSALTVAAAYRARWTIERLFQRLTDWLHCEQPGLGRPRAALFAFALALVASNLLAVVEAALAAVWGRTFLEELSYAALVDEVGQLWRGLQVALPARRWAFVRRLPVADLADLLRDVAGHVHPARFRKAVRGPKKPRRTPNCTNHRHRSTFRVLKAATITR